MLIIRSKNKRLLNAPSYFYISYIGILRQTGVYEKPDAFERENALSG